MKFYEFQDGDVHVVLDGVESVRVESEESGQWGVYVRSYAKDYLHSAYKTQDEARAAALRIRLAMTDGDAEDEDDEEPEPEPEASTCRKCGTSISNVEGTWRHDVGITKRNGCTTPIPVPVLKDDDPKWRTLLSDAA